MKRFLVGFVVLAAGWAFAQTCVVPAPPKPPVPAELHVKLPADGGTVGCVGFATLPAGTQRGPSHEYAVRGSDCAVVVRVAKQMAANDNGWNDGGTP